MALACGSIAGVVGLALWAPWRSGPGAAAVSSTSTTPVTAVASDDPVAPLTGLRVPRAEAARLLRPALVAKIDGAAQAMPQDGLEEADVVTEVRVEGISRYLAVWHSREIDEVGPIRSARTTDPDLLAQLGRPLFAHSGGNSGVLAELRRSDWFQDVSHDAVPGAYRRDRSRLAPHNLIADARQLFASTVDPVQFPVPLFTYRADNQPSEGEPSAGVSVSVGSDARFVWDPDVGGWRRWAHGTAHLGPGGDQLTVTNVVVLLVDYVRSPADPSSPEALSVGSGDAWVYSDARVQSGTWTRVDRFAGWDLRGEDGAPMALTPGTTWVVLADAPPVPLGAATSDSMLADAPRAGGADGVDSASDR